MYAVSRRAAAAAALLYVLAWVVGLSLGAPDLALDAPGDVVRQALTTHPTAAGLQYVLVEGVAGLLLVVLTISAAWSASAPHPARRLFVICGALAGVISIIMGVLGVALVYRLAPQGNVDLVRTTFAAINRLDGPKMVLLAGMALSSGAVLPRPIGWLTWLGRALALALIGSALAYGLLLPSLSWTAYVSGVLLLAWAASFGVVLAVSRSDARP